MASGPRWNATGSIFGYVNQCCTPEAWCGLRLPRPSRNGALYAVRPRSRRPATGSAAPRRRKSGDGMHPELNFLTAFLAGLVSFVSPCVLPLVPSYLSFLTGSSLEELKAEQDPRQRARVIGHAVAFVAGFTVVFMALGFTAGAIGNVLLQYRDIVARVGGIVVIV